MSEGKLRRDIGGLGAAFIALNGVVGAGIFAMPQTLVDAAGDASPYLILLFGALMLMLALVFGELAGRFDRTGGPVDYTNAAFGATAGYFVGWLYYLARIAALAANTNAFMTYAAAFLPGADEGVWRLIGIAAFVSVLTLLNIAGVRNAVRTLNVVTVFKFGPLLALAIWGLIAFADHIPAPQAPADPSQIGGVSLLLLYAFVGFEMATLTSGETRNSKRVLPLALVSTIAAMTCLYVLVQLAYVAIMQGQAPDGAPLAAAAQVLAGPWAGLAMAAAAMVSIGGNLFASFIVTPRITFAMAEEGSLPAWFGRVHARFVTPANSVAFLGVLSAALAMSSAFVWLAVMASLARMFVYLACVAALLKVRRDAGAKTQTVWTTALRAFAPLCAGALCVYAISQANADAWLFLGVFCAAGVAIYLVARRAAANPSSAA